MHRIGLILPLALAVCAAPYGAADPDTAAAPAPVDLAGEYRVAGVDGADIDLPHGITASITADRIDLQSDCIRMAWSYTRDGAALSTATQPVPSCRRALLPPEQAISEAFTAADSVSRTPANGLEFAGGGRSVLLFLQ